MRPAGIEAACNSRSFFAEDSTGDSTGPHEPRQEPAPQRPWSYWFLGRNDVHDSPGLGPRPRLESWRLPRTTHGRVWNLVMLRGCYPGFQFDGGSLVAGHSMCEGSASTETLMWLYSARSTRHCERT